MGSEAMKIMLVDASDGTCGARENVHVSSGIKLKLL